MTETSVGFNTTVEVVTEALDRLQPTAASHDRIMVLEVMGRGAGHIALRAGIAGGADVILLPEIPYDIDVVADHLRKVHKPGHNFGLVVSLRPPRAGRTPRRATARKLPAWPTPSSISVGVSGTGRYSGRSISSETPW